MGVWHRAVAFSVVAAAAAPVASLRIVVVIFHLVVDAAVVVVAGRPVEGDVIVLSGLTHGGQGW